MKFSRNIAVVSSTKHIRSNSSQAGFWIVLRKLQHRVRYGWLLRSVQVFAFVNLRSYTECGAEYWARTLTAYLWISHRIKRTSKLHVYILCHAIIPNLLGAKSSLLVWAPFPMTIHFRTKRKRYKYHYSYWCFSKYFISWILELTYSDWISIVYDILAFGLMPQYQEVIIKYYIRTATIKFWTCELCHFICVETSSGINLFKRESEISKIFLGRAFWIERHYRTQSWFEFLLNMMNSKLAVISAWSIILYKRYLLWD